MKSPGGQRGFMVDLYNLTHRLDRFPESKIHYFDENGDTAARKFPELAGDVQALVVRLKAAGLRPGDRVGILASNSIDFILWDLALLELRCTVVAFPFEMGRDQGTGLFDAYSLSLMVLARRDQWEQFAGHPHAVWLEDRGHGGIRPRVDNPVPASTLDVHALTFSSGSSGGLKSYKINTRGGEWDIEQFQKLYDLSDRDRLLIFLPLSNYQQRLLCFGAFWFGISLIICQPEQAFDGFARLQPTLCLAPPILYEGIHDRYLAGVDRFNPVMKFAIRQLRGLAKTLPLGLSSGLRRMLFQRIHQALGGRIRVMWTGMAPIRHATLEFFEEASLPLYEAYGVSEGGAIAANSPSMKRLGSVGKPIEGNEVSLADDGEILVRRKEFTTFGYFSPDPSWIPIFREDGTLATGDIGRFDQDGFLYLAGRKKEIIITSQGEKVHPERIEAMLNECPAVRHSVAIGDRMAHLVVLVSLKKPRSAEVEAEVAAAVEVANRRLAPTVRIARTVLTEETFTAANGLLTRNLKLDRRAIYRRFSPEIEGSPRRSASPAAEEAAAASDREMIELASTAWKEILGLSNVPAGTSFIDLGGDSLCAMRIVNRLQPVVPQISVNDVLEAQNVVDLVVRIRSQQQNQAASDAPAVDIPAVDIEEGVI
jgi:long-chain acyl-CoA synthetase